MMLYRLEYISTEDGPDIYKLTFPVVRETTKCYVIRYRGVDKYVLKDEKGKRFAYSTVEAAFDSLMHRLQRRGCILQSQLDLVNDAQGMIKALGRDRVLALINETSTYDTVTSTYVTNNWLPIPRELPSS